MNHTSLEMERKRLNNLSAKVIGLCIEVHRELGPGLLESAYEACLAYELRHAGLGFQQQQARPVLYKGVNLDVGFRLDFVIEDSLVVEVKSVAELLPIFKAQLMTYLKLERKSLGLLVNFNVPVLKDGVTRVVCGDLFRKR